MRWPPEPELIRVCSQPLYIHWLLTHCLQMWSVFLRWWICCPVLRIMSSTKANVRHRSTSSRTVTIVMWSVLRSIYLYEKVLKIDLFWKQSKKEAKKTIADQSVPMAGQTKLTKDQLNTLLKRWPQPNWPTI